MIDVEQKLIFYIAERIKELIPESSYGAVVSSKEKVSKNFLSIISNVFGRSCSLEKIEEVINLIDENDKLKFVIIHAKSINGRRRRSLIERGMKNNDLWIIHFREGSVVSLEQGSRRFGISINVEIIKPSEPEARDEHNASMQGALDAMICDFMQIYNSSFDSKNTNQCKTHTSHASIEGLLTHVRESDWYPLTSTLIDISELSDEATEHDLKEGVR